MSLFILLHNYKTFESMVKWITRDLNSVNLYTTTEDRKHLLKYIECSMWPLLGAINTSDTLVFCLLIILHLVRFDIYILLHFPAVSLLLNRLIRKHVSTSHFTICD